MDPTILHTPDLIERAGPETAENAEVAILREDSATGAKTMLVRLHPGGRLVAHAHAAPAQQFVLGGLCETDGKTLRAGTYVFHPAHSSIAPLTSPDGAELLIILDPES